MYEELIQSILAWSFFLPIGALSLNRMQ